MVFRPYKLSLRQKITNQNKVQCRLAKVNFTNKDVLVLDIALISELFQQYATVR